MNMNKLEKINQQDKFNKLFNDNYAKLKNVAFGMTRNSDDAEDILIVAYTNAWKKYEKGEFDENKKFMNWMNTIIRHCFIDFQRKKLRRPSSSNSWKRSGQPSFLVGTTRSWPMRSSVWPTGS